MPTLNIDGVGRVKVDDTFLQLSPEQQSATVEEIAASHGPRAEAAGAPDNQRGGFFDAFVGQGMLMGAGDEAKAAVQAGMGYLGGKGEFGKLYNRELESNRADVAGYTDRHPYLAPAAAAAGGVAGALMAPELGLTSGIANAIGRVATPLLGRTVGAGLGKALGATAGGAALGTVAGFNSGEGGLENRLASAGQGAKYGAIGGAALQGGAGLVNAVGRGATKAIAPAATMVRNFAGRTLDSPQARAVRMVNEQLAADDMTAAQLAARMQRSQPGAAAGRSPAMMPMDVGDEGMLSLARAASTNAGPSRRIINSVLDRRAAAQSERVLASTTHALGDPNIFRQTTQALARQRASHGDQLYGAAFSSARPVDVEPIVQRLDSRLVAAKGGIRSTLQRVRGLLVRSGTMGERAERDLRPLHEAKLELDNMLSSTGDSSIGHVACREIARTRRELIDAMDRGNPAYGAARRVYSDESSLMNALDTGRRFLREDVDDLADQMGSMGHAERQMFMLGVSREVRHIVDAAPDGADVVKRMFGSVEKRQALRSVFPNQREFRRFHAGMLREATARTTRDKVGVHRGSRTAVLQQDQGAHSGGGEILKDFAMGAAVGAPPVNTTVKAFTTFLSQRNQMSPEVAQEVARIMVMEDPNAVLRALRSGPQPRRAPPRRCPAAAASVPSCAAAREALPPRRTPTSRRR